MGLAESIGAILSTIEEQTNVSVVEMKGRNRQANIREARQLAIHFIHKYSGLTMTSSAKILSRHHSTGIHSNKVVLNEVRLNKPYQRRYAFMNGLIVNKINNG